MGNFSRGNARGSKVKPWDDFRKNRGDKGGNIFGWDIYIKEGKKSAMCGINETKER